MGVVSERENDLVFIYLFGHTAALIQSFATTHLIIPYHLLL